VPNRGLIYNIDRVCLQQTHESVSCSQVQRTAETSIGTVAIDKQYRAARDPNMGPGWGKNWVHRKLAPDSVRLGNAEGFRVVDLSTGRHAGGSTDSRLDIASRITPSRHIAIFVTGGYHFQVREQNFREVPCADFLVAASSNEIAGTDAGRDKAAIYGQARQGTLRCRRFARSYLVGSPFELVSQEKRLITIDFPIIVSVSMIHIGALLLYNGVL